MVYAYSNGTLAMQYPVLCNRSSYGDIIAHTYINYYSACHDNWCTGTLFKQENYRTVGGDGGCRVGEVRAGITSPMPDHKGFKLQ